jgi:hypothetical protein
VNVGTRYVLPNITFTSNAGIRSIQVREGAKTIKLITFKGSGPTQYALKSLGISTLGLTSGGHMLSVKVTDVRGRSVSKSLPFSICVTKPVFTG